jgi:hypothetical protein
MGKFYGGDNGYVDEGGGQYLSGPEKDVLLESGQEFSILAVSGPAATGYEGKSRFVLEVEIEGEVRLLGFDAGTVRGRDKQFLALQDFIEENGAPEDQFRLTKEKRSWIIVSADEPSGAE